MTPLGICPACEVQTAKWLVRWTLDLQSWTTALGKIFTFGAFAHTPDAKYNYFTCQTSPPDPHTMLKT